MAIIGSGIITKTILQKIEKSIVVVSPEEAENLPFPKSEPFIISNPYAASKLTGEDSFICKGIHQYREVKTKENDGEGGVFIKVDWVCQCGRKI